MNMHNSPLVWSDSFSVGNEILDNQHKKILGICAEIDRLAQSGVKDFSEVLFHMNEYAKAHFLTEEKLLAETEYPDTAAHKAGHQAYYAAVAQFNFSNVSGTINPQELAVFARRWWLDHILNSDMKYKPHFEKKATSDDAASDPRNTSEQADQNVECGQHLRLAPI